MVVLKLCPGSHGLGRAILGCGIPVASQGPEEWPGMNAGRNLGIAMFMNLERSRRSNNRS